MHILLEEFISEQSSLIFLATQFLDKTNERSFPAESIE